MYLIDFKKKSFDINFEKFDGFETPINTFRYINLKYLSNFFEKEKILYDFIDNEKKLSVEYFRNLVRTNNFKYYFINLDCFENENLIPEIINITIEYKKIYFVIFYEELSLALSNDDFSRIGDNVFFIINTFQISNSKHEITVFPYYEFNIGLQKNLNIIYKLFGEVLTNRKNKKYNFFNGIHKPHRFFAYYVLQEYNLINEGFVSYLDYDNKKNKKELFPEFYNFLNIDEKKYLEILNEIEIPKLNDSYDKQTKNPCYDFYAFIIPYNYSLQSYISIVCETNYFKKSDFVSISEKTFKPFIGFNIPLFFGQIGLINYLRNQGFDLFDDFFDNNYETEEQMINCFKKNIKKINDISYQELYLFYCSNIDRIKNNFKLTYILTNNRIKNLNDNIKAICLNSI